MPLTLNDLLDDVRTSRRHLLKHLKGLSEEQWTWKPYSECKSVRETIIHLLTVDRSALQSMETGLSPDFRAIEAQVSAEVGTWDNAALLNALTKSHEKLLAFFNQYADSPLDTEINLWGSPGKLARQVNSLSSEDLYHAGQLGYIRMASDPSWDYYGSIYS